MWDEFLPRPSLLVLEDLHKSFGKEGGSRYDAGLRQPSSDSATCRCVQSSSCEASPHKPRSWAHTVILRPEPSVDRTFGLTVALLGAVSGARKALGANVGCATR